MGGSDSKQKEQQKQSIQIAPDPLILRLRKTMKLTLNETTHATYAFMSQMFFRQISKNKDGRMSLDYSPFCSVLLSDKKDHLLSLVTCALVSPVMAISPLMKLGDSTGFLYSQNLSLSGVVGGKYIKRSIKKIIAIKQASLALLFLQTPIWELGWCGISYLEDSEDIGNMPFHSIFNLFAENQKQVVQEAEQRPIISQKIEKIYCKQSDKFEGKSSKLGENLLVKFIDRKPYLIGVHKQEKCYFFTKQLIKVLQDKTSSFVKPELQKQYLKQIDVEQMEIQSSW